MCQRTSPRTPLSVLPLGFVLKTHKHLKEKERTDAAQEDTACPPWRRSGRQPARAVRAQELSLQPRDPGWETCVTLRSCVTWQAPARRELQGLPGFPPPFRSLAVTLIPFFKSNLPSAAIDSYIFFSSLGAAKQHPAQLKAIQLQDQAHTAREAHGLLRW